MFTLAVKLRSCAPVLHAIQETSGSILLSSTKIPSILYFFTKTRRYR